METLHETWERFKGMLVICPHHGIPDLMLGKRFCIGLSDSVKNIVDASAGGVFLSKTWREGQCLLDKMAQNSRWITRNASITLVVHSVTLDPSNSTAENMATLLRKMSILTKRVEDQPIGNQWPTGHDHQHYPEAMNYVSNYGGQRQGGQNWSQQNQQYRPAQSQFNSGKMGGMKPSNNITPYPRPHGYSNQNQQQGYHPPQQQYSGRQEDGFARLEAMMQLVIGSSAKISERVDAHDSAIKNIETQMGQISMSLNNRPHGTLPADTQVNPKDQVPKQLMAVSLRNGRDLDVEQERARKAREAKTLISVPIELDESVKLTKVTAQPAQEEGNIQIETEKEAEIAQEPVVDVAADKDRSQMIGKKRPPAPFP
uniref:Uncharacterized protein LOC104220895 n=1 Tax=Nicotiana sylvestris TaxID=4096 RepID=A0A1U7W7D2_NICSY|nr:PREDICTED: uncharacterized protein LOC104220895 [Nicotiana sylvestris]